MNIDLAPARLVPLGLSFEISDLLLAQAVAASSGMRMVVELNHHSDCEELEEVIALYGFRDTSCRCLIWRSALDVVVQPMPGRPQHFASVAAALEWLLPEGPIEISDIRVSAGRAQLGPAAGDASPTATRRAAARPAIVR